MSSRAALRVLANVGLEKEDVKERLVLSCFWAILTSASRGLGRPADVGLEGATHSAAISARSAARIRNSAADWAARSASRSASGIADAAARSAADSADRSAANYYVARSVAVSAAYSTVFKDSQVPRANLLHLPLWGDTEVPEGIAAAHVDFLRYLDSHADWAFFKRWYSEMWAGTFRDWDLAVEVALLDPDLWNGDDALAKVAQAIREIEARLGARGSDDLIPEDVQTSNVTPLFQRAPIVQASMATLSETINLRLDAFSRLSRQNEPIAFYETLKGLPVTAERVAKAVALGPETVGRDVVLAEEIGRLRAQVAQLAADLRAAHAELAELRAKPWYKKSSVLFVGGTISTIISAAVLLSGEDKLLEDRWNKLAVDLEFLRSKIWPAPDDRILDEFRFELPDVEDV